MTAALPTPRICFQHSRFSEQDGWRLCDISLSVNDDIVITGYNENTRRTSMDVFTDVRYSDYSRKPKVIYSKDFHKYIAKDEWEYWGLFASFMDSDKEKRGHVIVTCLGDKIELIDFKEDKVIKSRQVTLANQGGIKCVSVIEGRELFIGFYETNKINVYDAVDLNEIKSVLLKGIQDGYFPFDMTVSANRIFVCEVFLNEKSNQRSLIFEENNGEIFSELTKPTDSSSEWYVFGLSLNTSLNVIAVAWSQTYVGQFQGKDVIVFYSMLSGIYSSFLIVEVSFGVNRIRISDRGDMIVTANNLTGEVNVYDMKEFLSHARLKETLKQRLLPNDRAKLAKYFYLLEDERDAMFNSEPANKNPLLLLEEKGVIDQSNLKILEKALTELKMEATCFYLADFYLKIRNENTSKKEQPNVKVIGSYETQDSAKPPLEVDQQLEVTEQRQQECSKGNVEELKHSLEAKATVTSSGGVLEIPNTAAVLIVPPKALPENMVQCEMHLRIIPSSQLKEQVTSFSSNSTTVLELLPDRLSLRRPARLSVPHCLALKTTGHRKAKIFISHHEKGSPPSWEEQEHLSYSLEDTICIIYLQNFCWIKISINDEIVEAKKLILYAAARILRPKDEIAEIHAGYYYDLPDEEKEAQNTRDLVIAHRKVFYFMKRNAPLKIHLSDVLPHGWMYDSKKPRLQKITYEQITSSSSFSFIYTLKRKRKKAGSPLCVFSVSQENGQICVQLAVHLKEMDRYRTKEALNEPSKINALLERNEASLRVVNGVIERSGGFLQIPDSGVTLKIPANALSSEMYPHQIWMKIIQNRIVDDQVGSLSSNAVTAVELFPSNVTLQRPAELTLPHCLLFEESKNCRARVYTNNQTGSESPWTENSNMSYQFTDSACILGLDKICCVRYVIDETNVKAKRIKVYTAVKKRKESDQFAELEVGYFVDIPGGRELLRLNPSLVVDSQRTLAFVKKQGCDLQFSLERILPEQWKCCLPKKTLQEIPFRVIASSIEHSHLFILKKDNDKRGDATCMFTAKQPGGLMPVDISLKTSTSHDGRNIQIRKTGAGNALREQRLRQCFMFLKKQLAGNWKDLGRHLNVITEDELTRIQMEHRDDLEEGIYQMLLSWEQKEGTLATPETLIDALNAITRRDLAQKLESL